MLKFLKKQKYLQKDKENFYLSRNELRLLAYELLEKEKHNDAIELFQLNIRLFPEFASLYYNLGEAYVLNGNEELAVSMYKKAIEINPYNQYYKIKLDDLEKGLK